MVLTVLDLVDLVCIGEITYPYLMLHNCINICFFNRFIIKSFNYREEYSTVVPVECLGQSMMVVSTRKEVFAALLPNNIERD